MGLKFLIVDDDAMVARGIARTLTQAFPDCLMTLCASGSEALVQLTADHSFDLIISDFMMPGMFGSELLHAVARQYPSIALILSSGGAPGLSDQQMQDACPAGTKFLSKPYGVGELTTAVKLAMSQKLGF